MRFLLKLLLVVVISIVVVAVLYISINWLQNKYILAKIPEESRQKTMVHLLFEIIFGFLVFLIILSATHVLGLEIGFLIAALAFGI